MGVSPNRRCRLLSLPLPRRTSGCSGARTLTLAASTSACPPANACCREPPAVERDPRLIAELGESELDAWWGYDLVAPNGLLDRIFRELQVGSL